VHTQINVSTPEEDFFSPIKRVFFFSRSGTKADAARWKHKQQQTAAATARPVAARWK
jgi:hypothetical protein